MSKLAQPQSVPLTRLLDDGLVELRAGDGAAVDTELWERALFTPARDLLARGGKSLRGRLVEAGWRIGGGAGPCPPLLPMLLEVLHAGSLIVDDIEDDSSHRRGLPSLHRRYGLPRALNCGNWMTFLPSLLLEQMALRADVELALRRAMGRAVLRCHHGQALDVTVRIHETRRGDVPGIVATTTRLKTGALTELAVCAGAIAARAPHETLAALARFGRDAGTGLQMLDDLGGLDGRDPHKRNEDLRLGRLTWPWAWLAGDLAPQAYHDVRRMAGMVALAGDDPEPLGALMVRLLADRGRARALAHLGRTVAVARDALGPAADALEDVVRRLEERHA